MIFDTNIISSKTLEFKSKLGRLRETGPRFTKKNLKGDRNRTPISEAKMRFTKYHNLMITSVFERK